MVIELAKSYKTPYLTDVIRYWPLFYCSDLFLIDSYTVFADVMTKEGHTRFEKLALLQFCIEFISAKSFKNLPDVSFMIFYRLREN